MSKKLQTEKKTRSEIQFSDIFLEKFAFDTNKNYLQLSAEARMKEDVIETNWKIFIKKDEYDFLVELFMNINNDDKSFTKRPYRIECKAIALFKFDKETEPELVKRMINYESILLIIGTVRGLLIQTTSNAPYGRYVLPALNIKSIIENKTIKKNKLSDTAKETSEDKSNK